MTSTFKVLMISGKLFGGSLHSFSLSKTGQMAFLLSQYPTTDVHGDRRLISTLAGHLDPPELYPYYKGSTYAKLLLKVLSKSNLIC